MFAVIYDSYKRKHMETRRFSGRFVARLMWQEVRRETNIFKAILNSNNNQRIIYFFLRKPSNFKYNSKVTKQQQSKEICNFQSRVCQLQKNALHSHLSRNVHETLCLRLVFVKSVKRSDINYAFISIINKAQQLMGGTLQNEAIFMRFESDRNTRPLEEHQVDSRPH